jgi:single-stranded-DNA-specific exonuclease
LKSGFKWVYPQNDVSEELFSEIKDISGSEIIAKLLVNRGITTLAEAKNFIDTENADISSPYIFPDMEKAVKRINKAVETQEHIVVFGDFDSDGVTSTSLLYKTLQIIGANASFYIPDRIEEGHGLNTACVCKLISSRKAKLLITVDCGMSNYNEVKLANSLGTDVIITDHHEAPEEVPPSYAIINPKTLELDNITKNIRPLAGVGVAYKLASALLEANDKEEFHDEIFYFVSIGTVGDVVPLLGENRPFVQRGMKLITEKRPAGVAKILELGGYKPKHKVSTGTVAFGIVPKINAVGRLADASLIVDFLLSEDEEKLDSYAKELDDNNKTRQAMCEVTYLEAEALIEKEIDLEKSKSIILGKKDWHPGIIGIVASKLVEKYYRPVLMVSLNEEKNLARGSARSVGSLSLFDTLTVFEDLFIQYGGHKLAAGFSFDTAKVSFESFRNKLDSYINQALSADPLKPELFIDAEIQPSELTENFIKELDKLEPYGECNPSPVFSMTNLTLVQKKIMGAKKNHLKLFLSDETGKIFEAVWWKKESIHIEEEEKVNIAFNPSLNHFNDKTTVQLIVKDLKLATNEDPKIEIEDIESIFEPEYEAIAEIIEDTKEELEESPISSCYTENNEIKFVDHRDATGFKKDFLNYMKSKKDNLVIFAESSRALNALSQDEVLKTLVINRTELKNSEYLVIMDIPPDEKTFLNLMTKTKAKEIHLIGLKSDIDPVEAVKKFSGMLKYAFNNKGGVVNIELMASLLAVSTESILACTELLDSSGVIEVMEINEDSIKFSFSDNASINTILENSEYQVFIDSLEESERFRQQLLNADINKIQKNFCQACLLLK